VERDRLILRVKTLIKCKGLDLSEKIMFDLLLNCTKDSSMRRFLIIHELNQEYPKKYLDLADEYGCSLETVKQIAHFRKENIQG